MPVSEPTPLSTLFDGKEPSGSKEPSKEPEQKESVKGKADDKPEVNDKPASSPEKKEKAEPSKKDEGKKSEDPPAKGDKPDGEKKEDKPSADDKKSDDGSFEKRWKDTAAALNREHQQNLKLGQQVQQLSQQLTVLQKKQDGTYDPEKDDPEKQVRPEDIAAASLNVGKTLASKNAAEKEFGKEKVAELLGEFREVFGDNQIVQAVVLGSESPVYEAMSILDRYRFEQKYGSKPDDIREAIKKEVLAEAEAEMRKRITQEIMDGLDKKNNTPSGLSSSRGSSGVGKDEKPKGSEPTPLKALFG